MIYTYRVTLPGIKGFYRLYKVNGTNSLYHFHRQLQSDLEFAADQPILFKALDEAGCVVARYALIDLGYGTVDRVTVETAVKAGVHHFQYFHDTAARKYVIVTLEGEPENGTDILVPTLLSDTKGPLPVDFENGYVAFEDIPEERKRRAACACGKDDCDGDCGEEDDDDDEDADSEEEEETVVDPSEIDN